ncbi:MAG: ATP-binding protein [Ruminococcus flavefaciens]|nr:ATP-binding protein [Ruminococcus flavefaciens]
MGRYLNSMVPFETWRQIVGTRFFVDKTLLLGEVIDAVETDGQKYLCITRPRRFGKSVMANMIGAFLGKASDSSMFNNLAVAEKINCKRHCGQHNVIFIDFSRVPRDCSNYGQYIKRIQDGINQDLAEAYQGLGIDVAGTVWDNLLTVFEKTKEPFAFVMDEWDAVFHMPFVTREERQEYLAFLKNLLKDQVYAELAYMTGVLPIAKYSSGSELNMFVEYDMTMMERFSNYFGFTEKEVDRLYDIYCKTTEKPKITRDNLKIWYDGYYTASGERLYNPRSVVCALANNQIANYWTSSGPYDEIFFYVKNNIDDIRDDLVLMAAGEGVEAEIQNYAAVSMELNTKDEIYSAMVIYGLLTYTDGAVSIPNRELMDKFRELLMNKESMGYVYRLANESKRMLAATLRGDTDTMADILETAHNTEAPIFAYNSETELSAVVNLVYLAARDKYRVEREDKAGKGYVDFIFYPECGTSDALILELKVDGTPDDAIAQIKERDYALRFKGKIGEKQRYTSRILAVGISYSKKTKKHSCKIEVL